MADLSIVAAPNAELVGRKVRELLDADARVAGFVGEPERDGAALDEFRADVVRDES